MDGAAEGSTSNSYSSTVALFYFFNLIVGTGSLALPNAFQNAGIVLGTCLLLTSAFASFVSATFVFESMSIANVLTMINEHIKTNNSASSSSNGVRIVCNSNESSLKQMLIHKYRRFELSEMTSFFLGRPYVLMTYLILSLYLFGDLAIYSITVPKSIMNILCSVNNTAPVSHHEVCRTWIGLSRFSIYRIFVCIFPLFCLPLIITGITKMKVLQLASTILRWAAFSLMIVLALLQIFSNGPKGHVSAVNISGFGPLFGVSVYAFMCHHSVPGLVTPIRTKENFCSKLIFIYALVFTFYFLLSMSGSYAFTVVQDIYTLNFFYEGANDGIFSLLITYFLALFPVFTLTSSYIIVGVTLTNNIKALISLWTKKIPLLAGTCNEEVAPLLDNQRNGSISRTELDSEAHQISENQLDSDSLIINDPLSDIVLNRGHVSFALYDLIISLVVIAIPSVISFITDNVLLLSSITGRFPGVGVQFIIPTFLIIEARKNLQQCTTEFDESDELALNDYKSPFSGRYCPYLIFCWALFSFLMLFLDFFH